MAGSGQMTPDEAGQLKEANGLNIIDFESECVPVLIDGTQQFPRDEVERYIMKKGGDIFEL